MIGMMKRSSRLRRDPVGSVIGVLGGLMVFAGAVLGLLVLGLLVLGLAGAL